MNRRYAVYIYVLIYIYIHIRINIYIYGQRERDRERVRERDRERDEKRETDQLGHTACSRTPIQVAFAPAGPLLQVHSAFATRATSEAARRVCTMLCCLKVVGLEL